MFTIEKVDGEFIKEVEKSRTYGYVKVCATDGSANYCIVPQKMADNYLKRIKEMEIFEDDIWIVTFPKCGTTWTQEMVWMLNNNLDYEWSARETLWSRFPFIEDGGVIIEMEEDSFDTCIKLSRPRHIKTHLPLFLLPNKIWTVKPKIVYVARNPKDAAISFYHHFRHLHFYTGSREDFLNAFVNNQIIFSPFNDHVIEFWKVRNEANIIFLFYEDMKRNLEQEIKKTMKFLGKAYSQQQIQKLCQHLSFESMRNNPSCNAEYLVKHLKQKVTDKNLSKEEFSFIRKGQIGSYEQELTHEENAKLNTLIVDPKLEKFEFKYKF